MKWRIENLAMLKRLVKRLKKVEDVYRDKSWNNSTANGIRIAIDAIEEVYYE